MDDGEKSHPERHEVLIRDRPPPGGQRPGAREERRQDRAEDEPPPPPARRRRPLALSGEGGGSRGAGRVLHPGLLGPLLPRGSPDAAVLVDPDPADAGDQRVQAAAQSQRGRRPVGQLQGIGVDEGRQHLRSDRRRRGEVAVGLGLLPRLLVPPQFPVPLLRGLGAVGEGAAVDADGVEGVGEEEVAAVGGLFEDDVGAEGGGEVRPGDGARQAQLMPGLGLRIEGHGCPRCLIPGCSAFCGPPRS